MNTTKILTGAASALLILAGTFFFCVGTLGLIRFGDVRSRLHALTKADNLGLGLVLAGAALWLGSWSVAGLMLLTWLFALAAGGTAHALCEPQSRRSVAPPAAARGSDDGLTRLSRHTRVGGGPTSGRCAGGAGSAGTSTRSDP
ncbi:cation:proton antiporter [Nesterenkonia massiliensis]|uniref:cation:proton antiporter n=1 Tax=Nesterenkonia massiliensis TaxID=1232429 RepID=UPI0008599A8E|nr:monovalent cation/H(+) antiporter subunit G [Nesterenkonia massiliensis]